MKYLLILVGCLFYFHIGEANNFSIIRNNEDNIILRANTCEEITSEISILNNWLKNSGSKTCSPFIDTIDADLNRLDQKCEANITSCVPNHINLFHNKSPYISGPNCWNLTLVKSGILQNLRYSSPEEMKLYLNSPLCEALQKNQQRLPGDIGSIKTYDNELIHAFVYVSEKLVYSKNGVEKINPYALQELNTVYDEYHLNSLPDQCRENTMDPNCSIGIEFYRCKSLQGFLNVNNSLFEPYNKINQYISVLEKNLSNFLFNPTEYNAQVLENSLGFYDLIRNFLNYSNFETLINESNQKEVYDFIINLFITKLDSIAIQIAYIDLSIYTVSTQELTQQIYNSLFELKK